MVYLWEVVAARKHDTNTLKNWIWAAAENGQPVPGGMSIDSLRAVLKERGEDGRGWHNA